MEKEQIFRMCGSIEQIAGVREVAYQDGRAAALRCAKVKNGLLEYELMLDKCLDPAGVTYRGINLSFLTKPGLQGRNPYDTAGEEAVRSIMGGAMFTCGLDHIHGCKNIEGTQYPVHGRMRTTPAEKIGMDAAFMNGEYVISVQGEMRQAKIFGENLVLRRSVRTIYGTREILFRDEVENQAFDREPVCFLYHCNFGFPFLTPDTRLVLPVTETRPRDHAAETGMGQSNRMEEPVDGAEEQVFLHTLAADEEGNTFAAIVNDELELAVCIRFQRTRLPYLTQWKSRASGDYAMALEPCNTDFCGREGTSLVLEPMQSCVNELKYCILEGKEEIRNLEEECALLLRQKPSENKKRV